jgi:hypothetical protein
MIRVEDIVTTKDFVSAFSKFLSEPNFIPKYRIFSPGVSHDFIFTGNNPFKTDKLDRRDPRLEKALSMFAEYIEGFEGDIVDLEEWFMSLDGADLFENDMDKPRTPYEQYSPQERLLGKINHLSKLDEFKKFDNRDKALEAYEKAKNELPNLLEKGVDLISLRSYIKLRLPESRDWLNKEEI